MNHYLLIKKIKLICDMIEVYYDVFVFLKNQIDDIIKEETIRFNYTDNLDALACFIKKEPKKLK